MDNEEVAYAHYCSGIVGNDGRAVPNVSLRLYADDTTAYLSDVSPTIVEFSFSKGLQTLSSWFESNRLTVNSTKTQALSVGPCAYDYSLLLNNARIEFLRSYYRLPFLQNVQVPNMGR